MRENKKFLLSKDEKNFFLVDSTIAARIERKEPIVNRWGQSNPTTRKHVYSKSPNLSKTIEEEENTLMSKLEIIQSKTGMKISLSKFCSIERNQCKG